MSDRDKLESLLRALICWVIIGTDQCFRVDKFKGKHDKHSNHLDLPPEFKELLGATEAAIKSNDSNFIRIKITFKGGFISSLLLRKKISLTLGYYNNEIEFLDDGLSSPLNYSNFAFVHVPFSILLSSYVISSADFNIINELICAYYITEMEGIKRYLDARAKVNQEELEAAILMFKLSGDIEPFAKELGLSK